MNFPDIAFKMPTDEELEKSSIERFENSKKNPNQFSYWFSSVLQSNANAPKTRVIKISRDISDLILKEDPEAFFSNEELIRLVDFIKESFELFNTDKLFIKNSLFSSKHNWKSSCFITSKSDIAEHVATIMYDWALSGSGDYATEFVVREVIETKPAFLAFNEMPVTEEYRFFSKDGETYAYQPYWPEDAIQDASIEDWKPALREISIPSLERLHNLIDLSAEITKDLGGDWSVDFLIDKDGKAWLIDMALASQSYKSKSLVRITN